MEHRRCEQRCNKPWPYYGKGYPTRCRWNSWLPENGCRILPALVHPTSSVPSHSRHRGHCMLNETWCSTNRGTQEPYNHSVGTRPGMQRPPVLQQLSHRSSWPARPPVWRRVATGGAAICRVARIPWMVRRVLWSKYSWMDNPLVIDECSLCRWGLSLNKPGYAGTCLCISMVICEVGVRRRSFREIDRRAPGGSPTGDDAQPARAAGRSGLGRDRVATTVRCDGDALGLRGRGHQQRAVRPVRKSR